MRSNLTDTNIAWKLWLGTYVSMNIVAVLIIAFENGSYWFLTFLFFAIVSFFAGIPAFVILTFTVNKPNNDKFGQNRTFIRLLVLLAIISGVYGSFGFLVEGFTLDGLKIFAGITATLFAFNFISVLINHKALTSYFNRNFPSFVSVIAILEDKTVQQCLPYTRVKFTKENLPQPYNLLNQKNNKQMQHYQPEDMTVNSATATVSNKIGIKGVITGALILIMLIPTLFITNLVEEREQRQKDVVTEVSNKWSKAQTITGPYIIVPYNETSVDEKNKKIVIRKSVVLLPENLSLNGSVNTQQIHRSIYNVLLHRSNLNANGSFKIKLPNDIQPGSLLYQDARLCIGLTDYKGIDGKVAVTFNHTAYDLTAGLPDHKIDSTGLSAGIALSADDFKSEIPFSMQFAIKGSEQLSFVPLAGNSKFTLQSAWTNPSFNGSTLPAERVVNEKGFTATWNFNKANLPFNTALKSPDLTKADFAFGVSMLQPADHYSKTMRSVKYAILIIGLTFSLFFIVELMQKKPVHPVQYVLVGLALVIFYSLLLSFSEYIQFDLAYLIAAIATISLITIYAKSHFRSIRVGAVFGAVLASLYGFIFVLIRLEDTALLVGSIGLFVVLALVMYASRKINWYGTQLTSSAGTI